MAFCHFHIQALDGRGAHLASIQVERSRRKKVESFCHFVPQNRKCEGETGKTEGDQSSESSNEERLQVMKRRGWESSSAGGF